MTISYEELVAAARVRLPQFHLIKPSDMLAWYESAINSGQDVIWHLDRLANVGGSECGIIVADTLMLPPPFGATRGELYKRKMMMLPLEEPTDPMVFGTNVEDEVRKIFTDQAIAAGWTRATDLMDLFAERLRDHSYSAGVGLSPDDIFRDPAGRVWNIDYKSPYRKNPTDYAVIPDEDAEVDDDVLANLPIGYRSQLHQGKYILESEMDCDNVGMMLIYGIHPKSMVRGRDRSEIDMLAFDVDHEPEITEVIQTKCLSFFSDYVLQGQNPAIIDEEKIEQMLEADELMNELKRLDSQTKSRMDELSQRMGLIMSSAGDDVVDFIKELKFRKMNGIVSRTSRVRPDIDLKKYAEQTGTDLGPFTKIKPSKTPNVDLIIREILRLNPDAKPEDFMESPETIDARGAMDAGRLPKDIFQNSFTFRYSVKTDESPAPSEPLMMERIDDKPAGKPGPKPEIS